MLYGGKYSDLFETDLYHDRWRCKYQYQAMDLILCMVHNLHVLVTDKLCQCQIIYRCILQNMQNIHCESRPGMISCEKSYVFKFTLFGLSESQDSSLLTVALHQKIVKYLLLEAFPGFQENCLFMQNYIQSEFSVRFYWQFQSLICGNWTP